jgi:hypothetical protein
LIIADRDLFPFQYTFSQSMVISHPNGWYPEKIVSVNKIQKKMTV